jgi:glutamate dehydrogenase
LQQRFPEFMADHRLNREIIATQVTNSLVNRMGASFALRMHEDTGATPGEVARAYTIAREVFEARDFWIKVEKLDNKVSSELQLAAMLNMWKLLRQASRWLLNLPGRNLDIRFMLDRLAPGLKSLEKSMQKNMPAAEREALLQQVQPFIDGGFSRTLAERTVMLEQLFPALDVVEMAARRKTGVDRVAKVFFSIGEELDLGWLRQQVEALDVMGRWHALSRSNLRDELYGQHNRLVENVLKSVGKKHDPVAAWLDLQESGVTKIKNMLTDMKNSAEMDYPTIAVAVRELGHLGD